MSSNQWCIFVFCCMFYMDVFGRVFSDIQIQFDQYSFVDDGLLNLRMVTAKLEYVYPWLYVIFSVDSFNVWIIDNL